MENRWCLLIKQLVHFEGGEAEGRAQNVAGGICQGAGMKISGTGRTEAQIR